MFRTISPRHFGRKLKKGVTDKAEGGFFLQMNCLSYLPYIVVNGGYLVVLLMKIILKKGVINTVDFVLAFSLQIHTFEDKLFYYFYRFVYL
jgi:hypothetical protein